FWVAGMLMVLFANPDTLEWFYSSVNSGGKGWGEVFRRYTLPVIAYVYGNFAFLSRTLRASLLDVIELDYIRTARAKGIPDHRLWTHHALRTSLLPIITVVVGIFPALIGGSIVIEQIFQINGLGKKIFEATMNNNLPVIMAVFTLSGLLSMLGYWVADLLYGWAFPRIQLGKSE
ncbi:MAG: ABC transporter permease, partial [Bacteroidota bacterium]